MDVKALVDKNPLVAFLIMESTALLHVDGQQTGDGDDHHGDESRQLSHDDGEGDEPHEREADGHCREREEPAPDAHEFKWLLKPLEHRMSCHFTFHDSVGFRGDGGTLMKKWLRPTRMGHPWLLEEERKGFRHGDERHASADGHHDSLLHILVSVLELEEHVERAHENDDGGDSLHQVGHRSLVRTDLRGGLGEASCSRAGRPCVEGYSEEDYHEHGRTPCGWRGEGSSCRAHDGLAARHRGGQTGFVDL